MHAWLDSPPHARVPRPGRRMKFIDPILVKLSSRMGREARKRLRTALAIVMGTEPVISMRDVAGASVEESIAAGRWAAEALVKQALAEESNRPSGKTAARRNAGKER